MYRRSGDKSSCADACTHFRQFNEKHLPPNTPPKKVHKSLLNNKSLARRKYCINPGCTGPTQHTAVQSILCVPAKRPLSPTCSSDCKNLLHHRIQPRKMRIMRKLSQAKHSPSLNYCHRLFCLALICSLLLRTKILCSRQCFSCEVKLFACEY